MQYNSRNNISAELADTLREMIGTGQLEAGSRLNEVHLARDLGVSRTPLREALATLAAEGAVESIPRRGMFVRPLTREEFLHLYAVRPLVDVGALRLAGIPDRKTLDRLIQLNQRMRAARSPMKRILIDDEWHLLLVQGCDNPVLLELIEQFIYRTRRYELAYLKETRHTQTAVDEHLAILTALESGNLDQACHALQTNLTSGIDPILHWLNQREQSDNDP